MTGSQPPPGGGAVWYTEDRCAIRWPLMFNAVFWPVMFLFFLVLGAVTGDVGLFLVLIVAIAGFLLTQGPFALAKCWPAGIRIDDTGVRIGGVRHAEGRQARNGQRPQKLPRAHAQRREVFFCPWPGVQHAEVVTGHAELRKLARTGRDFGIRARSVIALGKLWAPHAKALLVLNVDLAVAGIPEFRPPDTRRSWWKVSDFTPFRPSPVWFVPTRHPGALRAVLAKLDVPGPATRHPGEPGTAGLGEP